jgi:hypothetical protein
MISGDERILRQEGMKVAVSHKAGAASAGN